MALVRILEKMNMEKPAIHSETTCTYTTFNDENGNTYLQIDTYGSASRKIKGKKSQTTQFGPEALTQLKSILENL